MEHDIDFKTLTPDDFANKLTGYFAGTFNDNLGVKVYQYEPGYCICGVDIKPEYLNPLNGVHGGFLFTLADTAAGLAAVDLTGQATVTTAHSSIQYLNPAIHLDKVFAEAINIKNGKRIAYIDVNLWTEDHLLLAKASFTFSRIILDHVKIQDIVKE